MSHPSVESSPAVRSWSLAVAEGVTLEGASYQGGKLVHTGIADLLWGGGTVQPEKWLCVII